MDKLKLLIAEDDKLVQELYRRGIPDDFFEKRIVANGEKALIIFNSWKPDIIVLDVVMPLMTGFEVLKNIRKIEPAAKKTTDKTTKKSTVVIMATALGCKEDIIDCLKLGINGYIIKPIDYKTISTKIIDYYQKVYSE